MRGVELSGFFPCIRREVTDEILIDITENIVVLTAIRWNVFDEFDKFLQSLCLRCRAIAKFTQSSLQSLEDSTINMLVILAN